MVSVYAFVIVAIVIAIIEEIVVALFADGSAVYLFIYLLLVFLFIYFILFYFILFFWGEGLFALSRGPCARCDQHLELHAKPPHNIPPLLIQRLPAVEPRSLSDNISGFVS